MGVIKIFITSLLYVEFLNSRVIPYLNFHMTSMY